MSLPIDTSAARGARGKPRAAEATTYTITRCETCGQTVVTLAECVCGHCVLVHDIRSNGERGRCEAGAGLAGCGCKRFTEGDQ